MLLTDNEDICMGNVLYQDLLLGDWKFKQK